MNRVVSPEEERAWQFADQLGVTILELREQIAAVLALHSRVVLGECVVCLETAPCPTARATGVTA